MPHATALTGRKGGAADRRQRKPAQTGPATRSGIRKFGGGPVAAISAMYGVPIAARSAAAKPAASPPTSRATSPAAATRSRPQIAS